MVYHLNLTHPFPSLQVSKAEFSLKIMVSAGCGCVFHVGGSVGDAASPEASELPEVPHWECFIGDRYLKEGMHLKG